MDGLYAPDVEKRTELPDWVGKLTKLNRLIVSGNKISDLPASLAKSDNLSVLQLQNFSSAFFRTIFGEKWTKNTSDIRIDLEWEFTDNPLNPELAQADKQGLPAIMAHLKSVRFIH